MNLKHYIYIMCVSPAIAAAETNTVTETVNSPLELQQVVVTGTRTKKILKDTPVQTRVISQTDIINSDATNIQELLTMEIPGVEYSFAMNQLTHLNFSGFGGQSLLFLVDGERLSGETMDDVDFLRLTLDNVDHVEIIKGAASALYGSSASGGVINIITKKPEEKWKLHVGGRTRVGKREENRYGMNLMLRGNKLSNTLSYIATNTASYNVENGPLNEAETNFFVKTYYGDHTKNVSDKLTWELTKDIRLTAHGSYYFREKSTTTPTMPDHYRDLTLGLRGTWDISKNDYLEMGYNFDQFDKAQHSQITDLCVRTYSNVQNSVRVLYNHTFTDGNILTAGGDYMRDYMLNTKTAAGEYHQHTANVFAQFDWNISDRWELLTALRYDYLSEGHHQQLTPKVNLRYRVLDNLTLRAGYGMGFRAPTLKERYYIFNMAGIWDIVGAEVVGYQLKPEQSHNFNLSAEYSNKGLYLMGSAYYTMIHNRITPGAPRMATDFQGDQSLLGTDKWLPYTNVRRYNAHGFDITAEKRWANGIDIRLSYAYIKEELPRDDNGEIINNQYQPARPHSITMRCEWDKQIVKNYGINIALSGRFLSAVDNVEFVDYQTRDAEGKLLRTNTHYKAYTIWKLQATQRIYERVRFTMTLDNLLNYNPKYHYFNAPFTDGIAVMLGMSIDLK